MVYEKIKSFYVNTVGVIKPIKILYTFIPFLNLYPDVIEIEVTNMCNLHCIMCGSNYMKRKRGFMSFAFYKKIINQIAGKIKSVGLYSTGEPLLHKKLPEMIRYAKIKGVKTVSVSTNATLLNEELSKKLISSGLDILQLSIKGADKEEYEKIRRDANFEKVRGNIANFLKIRGTRKKPRITINLLIYQDTDVPKFVRTWKDFCDEIIASEMQPIIVFDENKKHMVPILPSGIKLCEKSNKVIGCNLPFVMPVISYDGKVGMCCSDFDFALQMGDARKENILKIFNNKKYKDMRKRFVLKRFEGTPCEGCLHVYAFAREKK